VAVAGPDQYETDALAIVSAAVPPPVVKFVLNTVAVKEGAATPLAVP